MKKIEYRKSLVMLVALACLCSACGEDNESTKGKTGKVGDAEITDAVDDSDDEDNGSDEENDNENATSSNIDADYQDNAVDDIQAGPSTDHVTEDVDTTDDSQGPADPDADPSGNGNNGSSGNGNNTNPSGNTGVPATQPEYLGAANLANGGFATGDGKYNYYVVHPEEGCLAIIRETRATGDRLEIYRSIIKPAPVLDSLILVGDTLYFREDALDGEVFGIQKMDLTTKETECIADGAITGMTAYGDSLYFCKENKIVRCSLDGNDERVLFESKHSAMTAKVAFCVTDGKIYFSDPANFATGGMFFGKLYSMDLEGKNHTEIPADVEACNDEIFFSDGERLYFFGNTDSDGSGYYSCKIDGSDLQMTAKAAPTSRNISEDVDVVATADEMYVDTTGNGHELLYTGTIRMGKIVIVGEEIYFMGPDDTNRADTVTKRIKINGADEMVLG